MIVFQPEPPLLWCDRKPEDALIHCVLYFFLHSDCLVETLDHLSKFSQYARVWGYSEQMAIRWFQSMLVMVLPEADGHCLAFQ